MKWLAIVLSVIGIASGVVVAVGPWLLGVRSIATASLVLPAALGLILMLTHWLTLRRILSSSPRRAGLVILNLLLFAIVATGFLYLPANPAQGDRPMARMVLLALLFMAPLASNVVHLAVLRR